MSLWNIVNCDTEYSNQERALMTIYLHVVSLMELAKTCKTSAL